MPGHARRQFAIRCAAMAEQIEMPCQLWTGVQAQRSTCDMDAHWCQLANTTEPSHVRVGRMKRRRYGVMSNYFDYLFV